MADHTTNTVFVRRTGGKHLPKQQNCRQCGDVFTKNGNSDRAFCGEGCKARYRTFYREAKKPIRFAVYKYSCAFCGKRCTSQSVVSRYCSTECSSLFQDRAKHPGRFKPRPCIVCGKQFTPAPRSWQRSHCSEQCSAQTDRKHKRTARVRRKALQRGVSVESVDPIKVFTRDGWKCKLCGVRTPKAKRGTYHHDAPELDHIIPLSRGGNHSYLNTQCACRSCNAAKGDRPMGQMLLFG